MTLTFGSLFAGSGGFDFGYERAGMACRWQVEIDRECQRVLAHHWPEVERHDDVRDVGAYNIDPVDVITFGSPCQDLSVAGKRRGMEGERSGLYFEAVRIIRELRPGLAVWENVPGAFSSNAGRDFGAALDALADAGALDIGWTVLDAQWFGVAQRRRRVFVVADFRDQRAGEILAIPYGRAGDSAPRREAGQKTAFTLAASARATGDGHGNAWNSTYVTERDVAHALCSRTAKGGDPTTDTYVTAFHATQDPISSPECSPALGGNAVIGIAHILRPAGCDASEDGTGRGTPLVVDTTQITSQGNYSNPKPGDACHPLASGAHPPLMVQPSMRRLTPTECERLHGFPDGWTAGTSDSARYRMLGNAVAEPVAEWIGRRIVEAAS